ncbi:hypothetical protein B566_EDAN009805 [Ephemera danica]|nr:hypothetical protein B566_EDAN009805 [Ephemera danica]
MWLSKCISICAFAFVLFIIQVRAQEPPPEDEVEEAKPEIPTTKVPTLKAPDPKKKPGGTKTKLGGILKNKQKFTATITVTSKQGDAKPTLKVQVTPKINAIATKNNVQTVAVKLSNIQTTVPAKSITKLMAKPTSVTATTAKTDAVTKSTRILPIQRGYSLFYTKQSVAKRCKDLTCPSKPVISYKEDGTIKEKMRSGNNRFLVAGGDYSLNRTFVTCPENAPVADELWANGEPNNDKGVEACVTLRLDGNNGGLVDSFCMAPARYVCLFEPEDPT